MNCNEVRDKLIAYLDHTLDTSESIQVENHCEKCPGCKEELEDLQFAIDYLVSNGERISTQEIHWQRKDEKNIHTKKYKKKKRFTSGILVAAILTLFIVSAFAIEGFNVIEWWKNQSLKESESIEALLAKGYGERLDLVVEDQDVRITIESVIADEVSTVLLLEIEDLKGERKYEVSNREGGLIAKGSFQYNRFSISPRSDESLLGGTYIFYTPEKNITREIITLDPIAREEGNIDLTINEVRQLDFNRNETLKGNWNFQVPIKRFDAYTYEINQEMNLDGNIIIFEKIVIAPTMTVLTYRYQSNQNRYYTIDRIHGLKIEANGKDYSYRTYGIWSGFSDSSGLMRKEIRFDSMYFDLPDKIKIKVEGYEVTVKKYGKIDIDLNKPFPQNFEYLGSPITIDRIELTEKTARILMTDHMENREYTRIEFELNIVNNNFTKTGIHTDGYYMDAKGKKVNIGDYENYMGNKEKMKFYITSYDILIENHDFAEEIISKINEGTLEIIPYRIQIRGYPETRLVKSEITVKLD